MGRGRIIVPEITEDHLGAAQSVRVRYGALDLSLADAVSVALAADYADYDTDVISREHRRTRPTVTLEPPPPSTRGTWRAVVGVEEGRGSGVSRRRGPRRWP
ncbi:hypothetical protein GCM10017557_43880 [Streptomyces aurantiacus]|uniref:Uncharacterized protein n=1 Tax=Streptomyces aurantiacus TaxID=47760 RepID=A0A7G1P2R6_9ACTN|nr:hypothetical protein GCM10017557_43880 [Streptomyces aurantiacus]